MIFQQLFESGMSFEVFAPNNQDANIEKLQEIYNGIELDDELINKIQAIDKPIYILVFAELWCPDCIINLPAVKRAYEVDGVIKAFVVSCVGYVGPIEVLAALDDESDELKGIEILNHNETVGYAEHIEENWFLERFKGIGANKYLNLVVLDKEKPEDIIQVTGATVSSQAVVNAVNAAIGAYQYKVRGIEMGKVPDLSG